LMRGPSKERRPKFSNQRDKTCDHQSDKPLAGIYDGLDVKRNECVSYDD
jgi:hypothetical protein